MTLILVAVGLFLAYRILSKKRADGSSVLPSIVLPASTAPNIADVEAAMKAYAAKLETEIVGRVMAMDSLKARADLHARAAEAANGTPPAPKA